MYDLVFRLNGYRHPEKYLRPPPVRGTNNIREKAKNMDGKQFMLEALTFLIDSFKGVILTFIN